MATGRYYVRANNDEGCSKLIERDGMLNDGTPEDAVLARFSQPFPTYAGTLMAFMNGLETENGE